MADGMGRIVYCTTIQLVTYASNLTTSFLSFD
jgi:hypothetical protein